MLRIPVQRDVSACGAGRPACVGAWIVMETTSTPPQVVPLTAAPPPLAPVAESARVVAVDVLRGFALLGILAMNIITFALPLDAYVDPMNEHVNRYAGAFTGANRATWFAQHVLFDQKMMSIFSMLFGAGLVLMS